MKKLLFAILATWLIFVPVQAFDSCEAIDNLITANRKGHLLEIDYMFKGMEAEAKAARAETDKLAMIINDMLLNKGGFGRNTTSYEYADLSELCFGPKITCIKIVDGSLEVHFRKASQWVYPEGGGPPGEVWKDVYHSVDGKIVFKERIKGEVVPEQAIPERIVWPDEVETGENTDDEIFNDEQFYTDPNVRFVPNADTITSH